MYFENLVAIVHSASRAYYCSTSDDESSCSSQSVADVSTVKNTPESSTMQSLMESVDVSIKQSQLDHDELKICRSRLATLECEGARLRVHLSSLEGKSALRAQELGVLRERLRDIYSHDSTGGCISRFKSPRHRSSKENYPDIVFIPSLSQLKISKKKSVCSPKNRSSSPGSATMPSSNIRRRGRNHSSSRVVREVMKKDSRTDFSFADTDTHSDITGDAELTSSTEEGSLLCSSERSESAVDVKYDEKIVVKYRPANQSIDQPTDQPLHYIRIRDLNLCLDGNDLYSGSWLGLYPSNFSDRGRQKLVAKMVDSLAHRAMKLEKSSEVTSGAPVKWKPDSGTDKHLRANNCDSNLTGVTPEMFNNYFGKNILVWQGAFTEQVYKCDLPAIKTRAIICVHPR
mmetsp:Transcript_32893/g.75706  ORF Transcript_32893/g.75706 Transcript_32893/m.75706 type:complete len:401 (+) Transcript_32893:274-1476(+)